MGKEWSIFGGVVQGLFLEIAIINSASRFLFDLLFMCRLKDVSVVIFYLCF